jgi:hypothetical protein
MMPLLGEGAMVTWHDVLPEAEEDHDEWHSKEHMAERLGVSGFLRGYRFSALQGAPRHLIMYEVAALATLTSAPYLERLNNPTPWTRRVQASVSNSSRTLCRVVASFGNGVPGVVATLQLAPEDGREQDLRRHLAEVALPRLVERPGVLGAHLLEGDPEASRRPTEEKRLRGTPDRIAHWIVLLGGYDPDALASACEEALSPAALRRHGAAEAQTRGLYRLHHCLARSDLEQ